MALVGKDQLVQEVAERSGLEIAEARRAVEEMFKAIETQLGNGNEVRLTGFGKFSVSRRKAREGRNPQTGEPMKIAAKKVPHFSAGAELRKSVPPAPQKGASKSKSIPAKGGSASGGKGSQDKGEASRPDSDESRPEPEQNSMSPIEESPNEVDPAGSRSEGTAPEDEETRQNERKRAKGTRRGPKIPRKPTPRTVAAAPEAEAAPDSSGADEGSDETSAARKAASVAASGGKFALVAAAGLAAGVAGGLAVMHRR